MRSTCWAGSSGDVGARSRLDAGAETLLKHAMDEMGFSARAHDKILRVSRTISDLERSERITEVHLSEAINYRTLDRQFWR